MSGTIDEDGRKRTDRAGRKGPTYSAPALEKGLDVLELLASVSEGLTQSMIAERLGRSVQEVYRMVVSLERRGYIARQLPGDTFRLSMKLYKLAYAYPPIRRLSSAARPIMQRLSIAAGQAFLLSVLDGVSIWAVAHADSPEAVGFRVRLGTPSSVARTASGRVLLAFQEPDVRDLIYVELQKTMDAKAFRTVRTRVAEIEDRGYEWISNETIRGVTDVSIPILDIKGTALAALTMPFLEHVNNVVAIETAADMLAAAAEELSDAVGGKAQSLSLPLGPH